MGLFFFSFAYSTHVHWSWSEIVSCLDTRQERIFTLINEAGGNTLVNICWRLCKSFSRRLDCWSLGVTESNTPNIPPAPPKPHPFTSLPLVVRQDHVSVTWPMKWQLKGWVVLPAGNTEAGLGVSSVSSTALAAEEAAPASVQLVTMWLRNPADLWWLCPMDDQL